MIWKIELSSDAYKFLKRNKIPKEKIFELIRKAIRKFQGKKINIDIKKLKGKWLGFYRIRKGKLRVICEFNFDKFSVLIEEIDWRGGVYK
ncbi:MAG: type II toxin-antitoxin system RelE/ParE family toxin [Thermoprotei archaeon]|nr:MAG: type II toxin-antitoxin system RelE/ParE family toxin [Thermoprotei archaeon]